MPPSESRATDPGAQDPGLDPSDPLRRICQIQVPPGNGGWRYLSTGADQIVIDELIRSQILGQPSEVEILVGCPTVVQ